MRPLPLSLAAGLLALTVPARAQDWIGPTPLDFANSTMSWCNTQINNITLQRMVEKRYEKRTGKRWKAPVRTTPTRAAVGPASLLRGAPVVPAGDASLGYRPDPGIRAAAKRAFVARFAKINPAIGSKLSAAVDGSDFFGEYAKAVAPEGYRRDNVADAMASLIVVTWMGSKGRIMELDNEGQRIIRSRVATALAGLPAMKSAATPQRLGDELQMTTYFLLSGVAGAQNSGQKAQYASAMAAMFRGLTGADPNRLSLTSKGFVSI